MIEVLRRWREIAIIALLVCLVVLWNFHSVTSKQLDLVEDKNEELKQANDSLSDKVNLFEKAARTQELRNQEAERKRLDIIAQMSKQIGDMRDQTPPKECEKAIEWAIQNKGDLKWSK